MQKNRVSAGTPQRTACRKPVVPGMISAAIPIIGSSGGARLRKANISADSSSDNHRAWRNNGAIRSVAPAPCSCETEAVNEISVPIGTSIGSHNNAVPTVTAPRVAVLWWPAMTLSRKEIKPVEICPRTSGKANRPVARTSEEKRGAALACDM